MSYSSGNSGVAGIVADFRSDTVTLPTDGMRAAMNDAPLGDDVYGEDPTVNALEVKTAAMLGKEAGLFVSSGTQSNLIALMTHCGRGAEYIAGSGNHISKYEAGGAAVLGGISPRHLTADARGQLSVEQIRAAINVDDFHFAPSRLVCLENTYNGHVQDPILISESGALAHANGLAFHLDGARLMNAAVGGNQTAAEISAPFDTVSLCLSKGLGAPIGSVLVGPAEFIARGRRLRKMLGGGMRQVGLLAAAGTYALDHHVERLTEDHARAKRLAQGFAEFASIDVDLNSVETNMVFLGVKDQAAWAQFADALGQKGYVVAGVANSVRMVCHLGITDAHCEEILAIGAGYL